MIRKMLARVCGCDVVRLRGWTFGGVAALGAALSACGVYVTPGDAVLEVASTREAVVFDDPAHAELVFVVPGSERVEIRRRALEVENSRVQHMVPTVSERELLVMTGPSSDSVEADGFLWRYAADGEGKPIRYRTVAPFDGLALSPDGRFAVAHFTRDGATGLLQNANLVAIANLEGDDLRSFTLNGFGGRLRSVQFPSSDPESGTVDVGGIARSLVAFLASGEVVLVDMLDESETIQQVAAPFDEETTFDPVDTLVRSANDHYAAPVVFVRSSSGADVAMLTLAAKAGSARPEFTASVSLLNVGGRAGAFVHYDTDDAPYLISTNPDAGALVFTDIRTQQSFAIEAGDTLEEVFLRDHEDGKQVVTWSRGGRALYTLDLRNIDQTPGRELEALRIAEGIESLVRLGEDRVLIGASDSLYVVDFIERQVTPLTSQFTYDSRASALVGDRLLLGTPGRDWISLIDLVSLNPSAVRLDAPIASFHYLAAGHRAVALHHDYAGHMTVVDGDEPTRANSYAAWGFLLTGVLGDE